MGQEGPASAAKFPGQSDPAVLVGHCVVGQKEAQSTRANILCLLVSGYSYSKKKKELNLLGQTGIHQQWHD